MRVGPAHSIIGALLAPAAGELFGLAAGFTTGAAGLAATAEGIRTVIVRPPTLVNVVPM